MLTSSTSSSWVEIRNENDSNAALSKNRLHCFELGLGTCYYKDRDLIYNLRLLRSIIVTWLGLDPKCAENLLVQQLSILLYCYPRFPIHDWQCIDSPILFHFHLISELSLNPCDSAKCGKMAECRSEVSPSGMHSESQETLCVCKDGYNGDPYDEVTGCEPGKSGAKGSQSQLIAIKMPLNAHINMHASLPPPMQPDILNSGTVAALAWVKTKQKQKRYRCNETLKCSHVKFTPNADLIGESTNLESIKNH